jgi:glycosyltransferase involved in cell wall biosynthesis
MTAPLVSIVVPSYNQGRYIRETIESALSQDYRPLEVVVMDGGSSDETVAVLQSFGDPSELRWRSEPDKGVVDAVNKGLREARGEIVIIQSSDDVFLPGVVRKMVEAFERHPEAALIYGDIEHIDSASRILGQPSSLPEFDLLEYLAKLQYIPQASAFFRAGAAREAGYWREDISYAADAEFYLRIARKFPVKKMDVVVSQYRHHETQRDASGAKIIRDWANAVETYLRDPDPVIRRHARLGVMNVRYHYTPEHRWLSRTWLLYRSALLVPRAVRHPDIRARKDWLPGRYPIWRMLSRIKRMLMR